MYSPLPYYVLADMDRRNKVIGYRVCFMPEDQPGTHIEVEDGYFGIRGRGWQVALVAANNLRDELNAVDKRLSEVTEGA